MILNEEAATRREGFLLEPTFRRLLACLSADENVAYMGREFRRFSIEELTLRPYVRSLFERLHDRRCTRVIVSNTGAADAIRS